METKPPKISAREGRLFETYLVVCAKVSGWKTVKIPNGARIGKGKINLVQTPFDLVFTKKGRAIFADAKKTDKNVLYHDKITPHQVRELFDQQHQGFHAGYIINYQKLNTVVFVWASELFKVMMSGKGIEPSMGTTIGDELNIELDAILKIPFPKL